MAASSVSRERYREYAHFLRLSADNLNMTVAPQRLRRLKAQVSGERNKFLIWSVLWVVIALVTLVPMLLLAAVEFGLPLPPSVAARAEALHFQVVTLENAAVVAAVIVSAIMFPVSLAIGYGPIVAHANAVNDLECAHRALKALDKG